MTNNITFLNYFKQKITDNKSIDPYELKSQFNTLIDELIKICSIDFEQEKADYAKVSKSKNARNIPQPIKITDVLYKIINSIKIIDVRYNELFKKLYKFSIKYVENKSGNTYTLIPLKNDSLIIQEQKSAMDEIIKYQVLFDFYILYIYLLDRLNILQYAKFEDKKQEIREINQDVKTLLHTDNFAYNSNIQIINNIDSVNTYLAKDTTPISFSELFKKINAEKNLYVYTSENTQPEVVEEDAEITAAQAAGPAAQPPGAGLAGPPAAAAAAAGAGTGAAAAAQAAGPVAQPPPPPPPAPPAAARKVDDAGGVYSVSRYPTLPLPIPQAIDHHAAAAADALEPPPPPPPSPRVADTRAVAILYIQNQLKSLNNAEEHARQKASDADEAAKKAQEEADKVVFTINYNEAMIKARRANTHLEVAKQALLYINNLIEEAIRIHTNVSKKVSEAGHDITIIDKINELKNTIDLINQYKLNAINAVERATIVVAQAADRAAALEAAERADAARAQAAQAARAAARRIVTPVEELHGIIRVLIERKTIHISVLPDYTRIISFYKSNKDRKPENERIIHYFSYKSTFYSYKYNTKGLVLYVEENPSFTFGTYIMSINRDDIDNSYIYLVLFCGNDIYPIQLLSHICATNLYNIGVSQTNRKIFILNITKKIDFILYKNKIYQILFDKNCFKLVELFDKTDYNIKFIIVNAYILKIKDNGELVLLYKIYESGQLVIKEYNLEKYAIINPIIVNIINETYKLHNDIMTQFILGPGHIVTSLFGITGGANPNNDNFEALPIIIRFSLLKEIYKQVFKKNTSNATTTSASNDISLRGPLSRNIIGFDNESGIVYKRHKNSLVYWQRTFNNICKKLLNNSKITSKEIAIFNSIENRVNAVIIKVDDNKKHEREKKRKDLLEYIRDKKAELKKNNIEFKDENIINTSKILLNFINVAYIFKLLLVGLTIICIIIYIMVLLISIYNLIVLLMKIIASIIYLFYNTGLTHSDTLSYKVQNIIRCTKIDNSHDVLNVLNEQLTSLAVFNTNLYILYIILGYIIIYLLYFIYSTIFAKYYILNGNIKDIDPKFTLITLITIIFTCSFIHLLIYKFLFKSVCYNNYKKCATDEKTADDTIKTYLKSFKDFDDVAENDKFYMLLTDSTKKDEIDIKFQKMVLELEDSILINNLGKYLLIYNINTYFQEYLYINDETKESIKDYFDKVIKDEEPSKSLISFLDLNERRLIKSYHEELPFYNQIPADKVEYFNIINGNVNDVLSSINKSIIKYTGTFYPFLFTCIYIFIICIYNIITTYIILRYISDNKDEQLFPQFIYTMSDKILSIFYRIYNLFI